MNHPGKGPDMNRRTWEFLPSFILRGTGFPFNWLERVAFGRTAAAIDELLDAEAGLARHGARAEGGLRAERDPASIATRRKARKRVASGAAVPLAPSDRAALPDLLIRVIEDYNAQVARCEELRAGARSAFELELVERRQALRQIAADPWFQEAVWLSSPQMYEHGLRPYLDRFDPNDRGREVKRVERQLVSYLQRFCAKNETAAFFGPVSYGDFDEPAGPGPAGPGAERTLARGAFIAFWAIQALAEAMAADPAMLPYLRPHRIPSGALDPERRKLRIGPRAAFDLSTRSCRLYQLADGTRTVAELAGEVGLSVEEIAAELAALRKMRAVSLAPRVSITESRPLDRLIELARLLPVSCSARSRWLEELEGIEALRARFAGASLQEKRGILAQLEQALSRSAACEARRSGGAFYADRLIIYEESLGGMTPLSLGKAAAGKIRSRLSPILDLLAAHACHVHRQMRGFGRDLILRWSPERSMPFLEVLARLAKEDLSFTPEPSPWKEAVRRQLAARSGERSVEIDPSQMPPVDRGALASETLIASPDLMLAAADLDAVRRGDFDLVFSECHDAFMVWGWAVELCPWRDRIRWQAGALLRRAAGDRPVASVLASRRVKILPLEYPGATLELMTQSDRPSQERISAAAVEVRATESGIELRAPGRPGLQLYNGELHTLAHDLFSIPKVVPLEVTLGRHTPRACLNGVVLQRERWQLDRSELFPGTYRGSSFELMYDFRKAARRIGLPRRMFARIAAEPKPVFIDAESYFLLELLNSLVHEDAEVILTEMLPEPRDLWVRAGPEAYCSELRLSACHVDEEPEPASAE
jgi:hypothetical protein